MPFVPDEPKGGFVPDREAELAAGSGPRGYTYAGQVKKPGDEPGFIRQAVSDMTSPTGVGAALGTGMGAMAAKNPPLVFDPKTAEFEEGGMVPNWLKPIIGAAAGSAVGAIGEKKDPAMAALGGAVGEMGGAGVSKALSPIVGRLRFDMGKYIGKIGDKVQEYFKLPTPVKTEQQLYEALHYDPNKSVFDSAAGESARNAYKTARQQITAVVGEGAQIAGDAAKQLREILYDHSPKFKAAVERLTTKGGAFSQENALLKDQIRSQIFSEPMAVNDAMELAMDLGQEAARKGGAAGKDNALFRQTLSDSLNQLSPGAGDVYQAMNKDYSRAMNVLRSFDSAKLFKVGKGGPSLNRPELIRQSNAAERTLKKVDADELDAIVRFGKPPGYTSSTISLGGSGHLPWPLNVARVHLPRKEFEVRPLLPEPDIVQKMLDAALRSGGAYTGAEMGK